MLTVFYNFVYFYSFILREGEVNIHSEEAIEVWNSLAENSLTPQDREVCFEWFNELVSEEIITHETTTNKIFLKVLSLPVTNMMTGNSYRCFEEFFITVNVMQGKLTREADTTITLHPNLTGLNYAWEIILQTNDEIAEKASKLLRDISVNVNVNCKVPLLNRHERFIDKCYNILKEIYDSCCNEGEIINIWEMKKLFRVLKLLSFYIEKHDKLFRNERNILPLYRAFRGSDIIIVIQYLKTVPNGSDFEFITHEYDILLSIHNCIITKIDSAYKIELFYKGKMLSNEDYSKRLIDIPLLDRDVSCFRLFLHIFIITGF